MDYGNAMYGGVSPVADGYLTTLDTYDARIYCYGKGPSALTVEAPMAAITQGSSLVVRGTVTDIAAGTKQNEQAARFPNGVPAVSDASQSQWMEYVYMQKPRPTDTTGVSVTLSVVDSNGNFREIGKTTSNADGFFAFNWKPDITGQFTVYAAFAGSESYYPSHAVTAFAVDQAAATPAPTEFVLTKPCNHNRSNDVLSRWSSRYNHCDSNSWLAYPKKTPIEAKYQKNNLSPFLVLNKIRSKKR